MKYKVIADVNDYKDRLKSYKNYLIEKQRQKANYFASEWDNPNLYMTKEEVDAYNAGWDLALMVARCNLEMWFPELKKEN